MRDYIFIIGTTGIGKSTLAKSLQEYYSSTVIEQNMIPEFISRDGKEEMTGALEEKTCWENQVAMLKCFNRLGYKNVIGLDFDDLRTRDIPSVFKGKDYITIKMVSTNLQQIKDQMKNREGGLVDFELQEKANERIMKRENLVNEFTLDVANLSKEQVLEKAIEMIENVKTLKEYDYIKPNKKEFYSWVFSNNLR